LGSTREFGFADCSGEVASPWDWGPRVEEAIETGGSASGPPTREGAETDGLVASAANAQAHRSNAPRRAVVRLICASNDAKLPRPSRIDANSPQFGHNSAGQQRIHRTRKRFQL